MLHNTPIGANDECRAIDTQKELDGLKVLDDAIGSTPIKVVYQNNQTCDSRIAKKRRKLRAESLDIQFGFLGYAFPELGYFGLRSCFRLRSFGISSRQQRRQSKGGSNASRNRRSAACHESGRCWHGNVPQRQAREAAPVDGLQEL